MAKNSWIMKLLYILVTVCFLGILAINIYDFIVFLKDLWTSHKGSFFTILVLAVMIIALLLYTKKRKMKNPLMKCRPMVFAIIVFTVSFIIRLLFVLIVNTQQYSDFQLFYWVTADIANKTFKYLSQSYFSVWAYQVGFPTLMSPIMMIFGTKVLPLLIVNCVFMAVTSVFIYFTVLELSSEKAARVFSLAYAFFPFGVGLSTVYTNQHLAAMFLYMGFYILIRGRKFGIIRSVLAGILFALSNVARPEAIIVILSILVYALFTLFSRAKKTGPKSKFRQVILPVGCSVLIYFIGSLGISKFIVSSGINPHGLSNNFPLYKFVIGLNHSTSGTFSSEDAEHLLNTPAFTENPDLRNKEAMKMIRERLSAGPAKLGTLFLKKARIMWSCNPSWYPAFYGFDPDRTIRLLGIDISLKHFPDIFTGIDFTFFILIFLSGIMGMLSALRSGEDHPALGIAALMFLAAFSAFSLIEVQHRYSYFIFPLLLVIASAGFERASRKRGSSDGSA